MIWQKQGRIGLAVAVMTVLGACRQGGTEVQLPVDDSAPVATDQKRYVPEVSSDHGDYVRYTINVSYTNANATSVYLVPCSKVPPPPDYQLEHFDTEKWAFNYRPICRTGPGNLPATEIKPGESFSSDLILDVYTSRTPENYGYPFLGTDIEPGVNRIVLELVSNVDDEGIATDGLLPLEQRVSNAFVLEAP